MNQASAYYCTTVVHGDLYGKSFIMIGESCGRWPQDQSLVCKRAVHPNLRLGKSLEGVQYYCKDNGIYTVTLRSKCQLVMICTIPFRALDETVPSTTPSSWPSPFFHSPNPSAPP